MKIPLHKNASNLEKAVHFAQMAQVNPKGFRTRSTKKNRVHPPHRVDRLSEGLK